MLMHTIDYSGALTRAGSIFFTLLVAGALPAFAQTLTPYDSGSVIKTEYFSAPIGPPAAEALTHDPASTSMYLENAFNCHYQKCEASDTIRTNSYALFDVPATLGNIASVELRFNLQQFGVGNWTGQPMEFEWQAWDVNSPPAEFQVAYAGNPTAPGLALFADLGSGIQYAGGTSQGGGAVSLQLQSDALADLAAARGGVFGIGFTVPRRYHNQEGMATASLSDMQLVVTTVPEPETGAMMLVGLAAFAVGMRRRARLRLLALRPK